MNFVPSSNPIESLSACLARHVFERQSDGALKLKAHIFN
jgi:hypothetical protein